MIQPKKINDLLKLPHSTLGLTEWISGSVLLNMSIHEWEDFKNKKLLVDDYFKITQTLTHESYHSFQFSITGYLYSFSAELLRELLTNINTNHKDLIENITEFINTPNICISDKARNLIEELNEENTDGISTVNIIEGAALLYEYVTHYQNGTHKTFLRFLENNDEMYVKAYKKTNEFFGENTFYTFLALTTIVLCFKKPHQVFERLLRTSKPITSFPQKNTELPILPQTILREFEYLGTAIDLAVNQGYKHPIYFKNACVFNELAEQISPLILMSSPKMLTMEISEKIIPPILFVKDEKKAILMPFRTNNDDKTKNEQYAYTILGVAAMKFLER